jgi:hypothetical protein
MYKNKMSLLKIISVGTVLLLFFGLIFLQNNKSLPSTQEPEDFNSFNNLGSLQNITYSDSSNDFSSAQIWFKPENIKSSNGRLIKWTDAGPQHLDLKPNSKKSTIAVVKSEGDKFKSVLLDKNNFIQSEETLRFKVLKQTDKLAVLVVFNPQNLKVQTPLADLFGWGDCSDDRFLAHIQSNNKTDFHMGATSNQLSGIPISIFSNQLNLAVYIRNQNKITSAINGFLTGSRLSKAPFTLANHYPFILGNSACNNGFNGQIYELIVLEFNDVSEVSAAAQYLTKKYSLKIN